MHQALPFVRGSWLYFLRLFLCLMPMCQSVTHSHAPLLNFSDNVDGTVAEHVVPLHDAEVQFAPETMTVDVVLGTGHRLRLLAEAGEEYRRWKAAMHETAQLWHARRQMALMTVLDVGGYYGGQVPGGPLARPCCRPRPPNSRLACDAGMNHVDGVVGVPAAFSAPRVPAAPAGLAAGRLQAVQALAQLAAQATALRARTRRAVTAVASTPPAQHQHLAVNGQAALPRFLRRAVADAVEKSESRGAFWPGDTRCRTSGPC